MTGGEGQTREDSAPAAMRTIQPVSDHPIPLEQEGIDRVWHRFDHPEKGDSPSVDEAHEDYIKTIAEWGDWRVFRPTHPFGHGDIYVWNHQIGAGFRVDDQDGEWHQLVNLFAEVVEEEGDCRDAEYSSSLRQGGYHKQRCANCGDWWLVG